MEQRLEDHYCGDAAWNAFVEALSSQWDNCTFKEELVKKLQGHLDIAKAVYGITGEQSLSWVATAIPALEGLRAVDRTSGPERILRLKSMLMRMPV